MPKYQVLNSIKHDGEEYSRGAEIELPAKVAKPLLDDGTIGEPGSIEVEKKSPNRGRVQADKETPEARANKANKADKEKDTETSESKDEETDETDEGTPHVVTEDDLKNNPELKKQGVKVGDEITLPPAEDPSKDL